jgi:flagellar M-ring protein FliF
MSVLWRVVIAGVAAVLLVVFAVFAYSQYHTEYKPLFTGLSPEEAGKLVQLMQTKSIPHRLEAGGTTISVPSERYAAARVELAAEGSSLTGKGFELFDESPLGMTPFVQNVNYSRALQAELGRSIAQLEPVAQARVHIVRPEHTPFVREQKPTTASVVLKLKPGAQLNRSSAQAIVALVSRAVEGLSPENVTIVDTRGRLLSDPQPSEDKAHSAQIELRRETEAYLANKAEDLLRRHLGVNRAIVRVAADVNLQRVKEKSEVVNPEGRAAVSERVSNQKTTGAAPGPRGVAGATSNLGRASGSTGAAGGNLSQQEKIETDYAVSKTLREQENRANVIDRLTVAALVDLSGQGEGSLKLTLNDARDLIKQAIGFKDGRDEIKVTDVRLGGEAESSEAGSGSVEQTQSLLLAIRSASLIVGLLLLVFLGILVGRRWWAARKQPAPAAASPPPPASSPTQEPSLLTAAPGTGPPVPPPEVQEFRQLVEADPDRVARLLTRLLEA